MKMNERETLYISYLVIAIVTFLTLTSFVIRATNDDLFRQKSKTADLALEINSVLSANGNLVLKDGLDGYYLEINNGCNLAIVSEKDQKLKSFYNCVGNNKIEINSISEVKNEFSIEKSDSKIIIK